MANTVLLDSGYTKAGVRWEIHRYNLRYASVYAVRVNGQEIMTKQDGSEGGRPMSRSDCYEYLMDSNVQRFSKRILDDGKTRYVPVEPTSGGESQHAEPGGSDPGGAGDS